MDAILYSKVSADGVGGSPVVLSDALPAELPGMQRYAIGSDICGRATIAFVEENSNGTAALRIVEER